MISSFFEKLRNRLHHAFATLIFGEIGYFLLRKGNHKDFYGDWPYFFSHFLSNRIYFWKNGLFHLPYYTPAFGSGLPQYGNPQDMLFTTTQWFFTLYPNPYTGVKLAFLLHLGLAYAGAYKLFRRFSIHPWLATFAGILFAINGYHVLQWVVGQINYQMYWVMPWFVLNIHDLYISRSWKESILSSGWLALCISLMLYGAGAYPFLVSSAISMTLLVALYLWNPKPWSALKRALLCLAGVPLVTGFLVISKIMAMLDYLRQFPREYSNEAMGIIRSLWLIPNGLFNPIPTVGSYIPLQLYGWWETCTYIGATTGVCLVIGVLVHLWNEPNQRPTAPATQTLRFFLIWTAVTLPVIAYLYMGWNTGWYFLKKLPILASLHIPSRYGAGLPLVLTGLMAALLNQLLSEGRRKRLALFLGFLCVMDVVARWGYFDETFANAPELAVPRDVSHLAIGRWITGGTDANNLVAGDGIVKTYDPLFAYMGDNVASQVHLDKPPLHRFEDGSYNVNDPVAMAYPKDVGRPVWSLIPSSVSEEQVRKFLCYEDPDFFIPLRQKVANALSLISWLIFLPALLWETWRSRLVSGRSRRTALQ